MNVAPCVSWTRRTAALLSVATFLLLLVGGLVTTYRVGMAVNDWPTTFGYSMFAYPLDEMILNTGVTQEHSHRMLGTIVGLLTIAALATSAPAGGRRAASWMAAAIAAEVVLVVWVILTKTVFGLGHAGLFACVLLALCRSVLEPHERGLRLTAVAAHLAVVFQGLLGGTRVLENSQQLAFLHGTCAQLVFLLVVSLWLVSGSGWRQAHPLESAGGAGLIPLAWAALLMTFAQVVLGAWLRHSGTHLPLFLHIVWALAVTVVVFLLGQRLGQVAGTLTGDQAKRLKGLRHWIWSALGLQWLLGLAALGAILVLSGGFEGPVTATEGITATLHVGIGALLLSGTLSCLLWSRRLFGTP